MLEVLADFVGQGILLLLGVFIVTKITDSKNVFKNYKNVIIILLSVFILSILYKTYYNSLYTIMALLINIIIYKVIFKESLSKTIIMASIVMLITFISDMIGGLILMIFFTTEQIRNLFWLRLISSIFICMISVIMIYVLDRNKILNKIDKILTNANYYSSTIFLILTIFVFTIISYNVFLGKQLNTIILANMILIIIFLGLLYLFLREKDNYNNLSDKYDTLFSYVQNFEDWIEKEQLNRHEYKNQLAVLRCLTKEKKVKDKIDEILEDNINIEGQAVTQLKSLPKGGIKGLMYYKSAIAQKNKLNLTTDVSIESKGILTKLSEKEIRILCKLIGIYFDNAIEAAKESRKKNLTIEIYELKDKVNIVFSNTFKKHKNMKDRNKKGVSSKGEGRGNGLYFASKLIKENPWIEEKQEIIDNYYIQELSVKKRT